MDFIYILNKWKRKFCHTGWNVGHPLQCYRKASGLFQTTIAQVLPKKKNEMDSSILNIAY
jgi:hypothetical protein